MYFMVFANPVFDYSLWIVFSLFVGIALALDLGLLTKIASVFRNRPISNLNKERYTNSKNTESKHAHSSDYMPSESLLGGKNPYPMRENDYNEDVQDTKKSSTFKHALHWTIVWISLSVVFAGIIYFIQGYDNALLFLTGYAIEKSLSMDNMFVFLIIFSSLGIPYIYQHKVLMIGIISAIVMRIALILGGITLLETFHWMAYVFGGLLLFTAIRMTIEKKEKKIEVEKSIAVRILKKFVPITTELHGNKFLIKKADIHKVTTYATPMLVALIIIEVTD